MPKQDDDFDFSEQIFTETTPSPEAAQPAPTDSPKRHPYETEVQSSYLLVNALMNLLIRKGIIQTHEVTALVAELHQDYMKARKEREQGGHQ